jgi:hypothetical protein
MDNLLENTQQTQDFDSGKYKKWERSGQHAQLLYSLVMSNTIKNGWTSAKILAEFPQFQFYNPNNFRSTVHRYRKKKAARDTGRITLTEEGGLEFDEEFTERIDNALIQNTAGGTYKLICLFNKSIQLIELTILLFLIFYDSNEYN